MSCFVVVDWQFADKAIGNNSVWSYLLVAKHDGRDGDREDNGILCAH